MAATVYLASQYSTGSDEDEVDFGLAGGASLLETAQVAKVAHVVEQPTLVDSAPQTPSRDDSPPPKFDFFNTPHNREFYRSSPYKSLDATQGEIRRLKLYRRKCSHAAHSAAHPEWPKFPPSSTLPMLACEMMDKEPVSRIANQYIALSYYAGSHKKTEQILVNGRCFNVFANLAHAMECALQYWTSQHPDREDELVLWVDQVCINQNDPAERASQVGMMQEIYRRSAEVFVCLSTAIARFGVHYDFEYPVPVEEFHASSGIMWASNSEQLISNRRAASRYSPGPWLACEALQERLYQNLGHGDFMEAWTNSLHEFLAAPWWARAWVYQEFVMARQARFFYNLESISWGDLEPLLRFVCSGIHDKFEHWSKRLSEREIRRPQKVGKKVSIHRDNLQQKTAERRSLRRELEAVQKQERHKESQSSLRRLAVGFTRQVFSSSTERLNSRIRTLSEEISQLSTGPQEPVERPTSVTPKDQGLRVLQNQMRGLREAQKTVLSIVNGKSGGGVTDLKALLCHSRNCQASDPRDRIYAFLGVADDDSQEKNYCITPNYDDENHIADVLTETAGAIIRYDGDLGILEHVTSGRGTLTSYLPTWVPEWTCKEVASKREFRENVARLQKDAGDKRSFSASGGTGAEEAFINPSNNKYVELGVKGIFIGRIVGETRPRKNNKLSSMHVMPISNGKLVVTPSTAHINEEVWVLFGAKYPVTLFPEKKRPGRFSFIGEAVIFESDRHRISDIMFGRAMGDNDEAIPPAVKDIFII